jgi:hypothetical protein
MSDRKRTTISLDAGLFAAAQRRAKALGYSDFSSYVAYLIEQDLRERPKHVTVREEKITRYRRSRR